MAIKFTNHALKQMSELAQAFSCSADLASLTMPDRHKLLTSPEFVYFTPAIISGQTIIDTIDPLLTDSLNNKFRNRCSPPAAKAISNYEKSLDVLIQKIGSEEPTLSTVRLTDIFNEPTIKSGFSEMLALKVSRAKEIFRLSDSQGARELLVWAEFSEAISIPDSKSSFPNIPEDGVVGAYLAAEKLFTQTCLKVIRDEFTRKNLPHPDQNPWALEGIFLKIWNHGLLFDSFSESHLQNIADCSSDSRPPNTNLLPQYWETTWHNELGHILKPGDLVHSLYRTMNELSKIKPIGHKKALGPELAYNMFRRDLALTTTLDPQNRFTLSLMRGIMDSQHCLTLGLFYTEDFKDEKRADRLPSLGVVSFELDEKTSTIIQIQGGVGDRHRLKRATSLNEGYNPTEEFKSNFESSRKLDLIFAATIYFLASQAHLDTVQVLPSKLQSAYLDTKLERGKALDEDLYLSTALRFGFREKADSWTTLSLEKVRYHHETYFAAAFSRRNEQNRVTPKLKKKWDETSPNTENPHYKTFQSYFQVAVDNLEVSSLRGFY